MKPFETIRYISFWVIDFLKGSPIYRNLKDIRTAIERPDIKKGVFRSEIRLKDLIEHAIANVPYYSGLKKNTALSDFPVINKNIINTFRESFLSQTHNNKKKFKVSTSGSTGTPFTIYQDILKKNRNTADMIYFAEKAGFKLGTRLYYVRLWTSYYRKSRLKKWIQNIQEVNILSLSEEKNISDIITDIQKNKIHAWLGYASGFDAICNYIDKTQTDIPVPNRITSAIAMSEELKPETKKRFEKYFGTTLLSRYSNMENGIIAQQTKDSLNKFIINTASYKVELLDMYEDRPVGNGELGRIVITDLFNYVMPLIRYDTGDIGVMETLITTNGTLKVFTKIYGRKLDVIHDVYGKPVSPFISFNIAHFEKIKQIQLIQEDRKKYCIRLNTENGFMAHKEIINQFRAILGPESVIELDFVDEIPLLASGKRKATVNNYLKRKSLAVGEII